MGNNYLQKQPIVSRIIEPQRKSKGYFSIEKFLQDNGTETKHFNNKQINIQRKTADFVPFLSRPQAAIQQADTSIWAQLIQIIQSYTQLQDDDFENRLKQQKIIKELITQNLSLGISNNSEQEYDDKTDFCADLQNLLITESQEVIDATSGQLNEPATQVEEDPDIKIEDKWSGTFKEDNVDIVDENESSFSKMFHWIKDVKGQKDKKVIIDKNHKFNSNWAVKSSNYFYITAENPEYAKDKYQNIISGYVKQDKLTVCTRDILLRNYTHIPKNNPEEFPLFPHTPKPEDIKQGALGDCYLLAAMISVVNKNPNHFVSHMRDNQNNTVTVKQYNLPPTPTPVITTVNKSVVERPDLPSNHKNKYAFARGALWSQIYEKAYVAADFGNIAQGNKKSYNIIDADKDDNADNCGENALMHITGKQSEQKHLAEGSAKLAQIQSVSATNPNIYSSIQTHDPNLYNLIARNDGIHQSADLEEDKHNELFSPKRQKEYLLSYHISETTIDWLQNLNGIRRFMPGILGSGKYTDYEMDIFGQIVNAVTDNKILTIGSKQSFSNKVDGLVENHDYALLDYRLHNYQGNGRIEILLRNPWGTTGRIYKRQDNPDKDMEGEAKEDQPEFWLDLEELTAYFDDLKIGEV